jgi:hypothetical protein
MRRARGVQGVRAAAVNEEEEEFGRHVSVSGRGERRAGRPYGNNMDYPVQYITTTVVSIAAILFRKIMGHNAQLI